MRCRRRIEGRTWEPGDTYNVVPEFQVDLPKGVEIIVRPIDRSVSCGCTSYIHEREDCSFRNADYVTQLEHLVDAALRLLSRGTRPRPGWTEAARVVLGIEPDYGGCHVCGLTRRSGCECRFAKRIKHDPLL